MGDDADTPRYIETVPLRGYRFILDTTQNKPQPTITPQPTTRKRRLVPAIVLAAAVALASALTVSHRQHPAQPQPRTLTRLTFDPGLQFGATWSPDGRFIAYSSDRAGKFDIWVQEVGGINPVRITSRPGHNWQPDWSPAGNEIAFRSEGEGGGLFIVPALGGPERRISSFGYRPRRSPDGRQIVFGMALSGLFNKIYLVSAGGGEPREILTGEFQKLRFRERSVAWSPDGRISAWAWTPNGTQFWTIPTARGTLDKSTFEPDVDRQLASMVFGGGDMTPEFHWAPSQKAIYFEGIVQGVRSVWRATVEAHGLRWTALERLTTGPGPDTELAISPDGKTLAFTSRTQRVRIWTYPFDASSARFSPAGEPVTPKG